MEALSIIFSDCIFYGWKMAQGDKRNDAYLAFSSVLFDVHTGHLLLNQPVEL